MLLGWAVTLLILAPNALLLRWPPREVPPPEKGVRRFAQVVLQAIERLGQLGCLGLPLFYRIHSPDPAARVALAIMAAALAVYYVCWARYLLHGRRYAVLFAPLWSLQLPMALSAIVYFLAASIVLNSVWLLPATAVLAAGHIPVSLMAYRRSQSDPGKEHR